MRSTNGINKRQRVKPVLGIERLEDRQVMSATSPSFDDLIIDHTQYDQDSIIVALNTNATGTPAQALRQNAKDLGNGLYRVELPNNITVAQAVAYFEEFSFVRYAQPDYVVSLTRTPNDPSFTSQWGMNNTGQSSGTADADIDAPEAWDITVGGGNTVVAVIDTGVDYNHPDLAANIWRNVDEIAGNGIDDDRNGFIDDIRGWDFANNDNNPNDDNGHGTHVAGIIGAVGNNGIGMAGVNWNVKIMPLKFLSSSGSGSLSNAILSLNYAVANGARVSNNSYGGGAYYQAFYDAVNAARAAGHIFVAAAGNESQNTDASPAYPASYNLPNILSVAALDRNNNLASFSNYGVTSVDLGAPGVSIYSTLRNSNYGSMSGTSMAAPFVAGAVALVADLHPNWSYQQIINQIKSTVDPVSSLQGKTATGGRLNIAKAVQGGGGGGGGSTDTTGASVTSSQFAGTATTNVNRVRFTFSEAISAASFTAADIVGLTRNGTAISGLIYTVTPVAGTTNQFDVTFATQSATGTYALTIGPNIADLAGNNLNQNGNGVNGESPGDRYSATGAISASTSPVTFNAPGLPQTIGDLSTVTSTLTVNQDITIAQLSAKLSISHTYDSDLIVTLTSPWGQTVTLINRRGGSGDNINTVFDDRATTPIANGTAPFTGWFKPEQALSAFANRNARGTWTLKVTDVARYDTGKLNSWSITVVPAVTATARMYRENDAVVFGDSRKVEHWVSTRTELASRSRGEGPEAVQDIPVRFGSRLALPEIEADTEIETGIERSASTLLGDWLDADA